MRRFALVLAIALPVVACSAWIGGSVEKWSPEQKTMLASLSLASIGTLPADPSNRVADDPAARAFGRKLFFDERLVRSGDQTLLERLYSLGKQAVATFEQPDAGPWEFRGKLQRHTFSAAISWAGCDRLARIGCDIADAGYGRTSADAQEFVRMVREETMGLSHAGRLALIVAVRQQSVP